MSKILTLALLILSVAMQSAYAGENSSAYHRELFVQYGESLKKNGIHQIAGLSVDEMISKSHTVRILSLPTIAYPVSDVTIVPATRSSGYWQPETNTMFLSRNQSSAAPGDAFSQIVVHEFFRAFGIADDDYNASALTSVYLNLKENEQDSEVRNFLRLRIQSLKRGGVSGVGGGGDIFILIFKKIILFAINDLYREKEISMRTLSAAVDQVLDLKIEVSKELPLDGNSPGYIYDTSSRTFIVSSSVFIERAKLIRISRVFFEAIIGHASRTR